MTSIRNIKFTYIDNEYKIESTEFIPELEVENADYDTVIRSIQQHYPEYSQVKLLRFDI